MAPVSTLPAQPPLPTARNLPFQFSTGIHNSISICESADGLSTAATRQCAGTCPACAPRALPCCPAATYSDAVIVVFGSDRDFKLSQVVFSAKAAKSKIAMKVILDSPKFGRCYCSDKTTTTSDIQRLLRTRRN